MAQTVRDAMLKALDDLGEKSFKRFCNKIMDWNIEKGFNKIPRSKLEKAETDDVATLILSFYMDSYGAELMVDVLHAINEKQVATDLKTDLDNGAIELVCFRVCVNGLRWANALDRRFGDDSEFNTGAVDLHLACI
ncbi:PREDICTED: apoptosis-associated speck-like protein containing a CARD [Nanorana parkeri]|uniref:apoptosis-associated speck-like protein containing a CARD n=1 Tax=Nanorana parkeri TaxID=125878 RepID=UPI000854176C|nr:PREDICTED: apoptosis-associated speck-like protein containing a CARD [Nanorana parkeri]